MAESVHTRKRKNATGREFPARLDGEIFAAPGRTANGGVLSRHGCRFVQRNSAVSWGRHRNAENALRFVASTPPSFRFVSITDGSAFEGLAFSCGLFRKRREQREPELNRRRRACGCTVSNFLWPLLFPPIVWLRGYSFGSRERLSGNGDESFPVSRGLCRIHELKTSHKIFLLLSDSSRELSADWIVNCT